MKQTWKRAESRWNECKCTQVLVSTAAVRFVFVCLSNQKEKKLWQGTMKAIHFHKPLHPFWAWAKRGRTAKEACSFSTKKLSSWCARWTKVLLGLFYWFCIICLGIYLNRVEPWNTDFTKNQLKWLNHVIRAFQTIHSFCELEITNKQKFILFLFGFPLFSNFFRIFKVSVLKTWNFVDKIKTSECELVNLANLVLQRRNLHSSLYILIIILKLCNNFVERLPNYANNTFKHYIERKEGNFGIQINFRKRQKGVDYNRMAMGEKTLYFHKFQFYQYVKAVFNRNH